jgi:hypothetical protein
MHIWGPAFAGTRLDAILATDEHTLDALCHWIAAYLYMGNHNAEIAVWPAGAFIANDGTVLFPPEWLVHRNAEAEGVWQSGAEKWIHPDRTGTAAAAFTAAALAYRVFCGTAPFTAADTNVLRQDIREGVFLPAHLAAPGLDAALATYITGVLSGKSRELVQLRSIIGDSSRISDFFQPVTQAEQTKLDREKMRFSRKQHARVKGQRFLTRNTTILAGIGIAVLSIALLAGTLIKDRANQPTTAGMQPVDVVKTYYDSIGTLDHVMMDACVLKNKTAKADITMVSSFYVITKMRQSYEVNSPPVVLPAQKWLDDGPDTYSTMLDGQLLVFGVSDLSIEPQDTDASDGQLSFYATYRIWEPGSADDPDPPLARFVSCSDKLRLVLYKGAWRIADTERIFLDNAGTVQ